LFIIDLCIILVKIEMFKRSLLLFTLPLLLLIAACSKNQESKIIGLWELKPLVYPQEQWEFTAENYLLKYEVTEIEKNLLTVGRWTLTKNNRLNIENFDVGFNGEWTIEILNNKEMKIIFPSSGNLSLSFYR